MECVEALVLVYEAFYYPQGISQEVLVPAAFGVEDQEVLLILPVVVFLGRGNDQDPTGIFVNVDCMFHHVIVLWVTELSVLRREELGEPELFQYGVCDLRS